MRELGVQGVPPRNIERRGARRHQATRNRGGRPLARQTVALLDHVSPHCPLARQTRARQSLSFLY